MKSVKVSQLDANVLDSEYHSMVLAQFEGLWQHRPLLRKALEAAITAISHFATHWRGLPTPGQEIYGLGYCFRPGGVRLVQLVAHLLAGIVGKAVTGIERFAGFERWWSLLSLLNFIVFLRTGRYPTLADRLAALPLESKHPDQPRVVDFSYTNRYLLVTSLLSFLRTVVPKLRLEALFSFLTSENAVGLGGTRSCAVCGNEKIVAITRFEGCGHVCCYYCRATLTTSNCPACA